MKIREIREMPTVISEIPSGTTGVHESCLRAAQILYKAKQLLAAGVSGEVVLELIEEMDDS